MLIIVEGPDEAGKTTLVKDLVNELDQRGYQAESRLSEGRPGDLLFRTFRELSNHVYSLTEVVPPIQVVDRFYFSEIFYSKHLGRRPAFSYKQRLQIERILIALEIPIIICLPPEDTLKENWEERSDNSANLTELNRADILREYEGLANSSAALSFTILKFDYTATLSLDSYIEWLQSNYLNLRSED